MEESDGVEESTMEELESEKVMDEVEEKEEEEEGEWMQKVVEEKEESMRCLAREVKILKQEKAEREMMVRDLELKVGVYEVRLGEERSKRVRVEEEMKEKVCEIEELKQRIDDFEFWKKGGEIESEEKKGLLLWPMVGAGFALVAALFYFSFPKQSLFKAH